MILLLRVVCIASKTPNGFFFSGPDWDNPKNYLFSGDLVLRLIHGSLRLRESTPPTTSE